MDDNQRLPKRLSQATARALLEDNGWRKTTGGKHVVKMDKDGERPITLPKHRGAEYSPGLTSAILRQAGLKRPASDADADAEAQRGGQIA